MAVWNRLKVCRYWTKLEAHIQISRVFRCNQSHMVGTCQLFKNPWAVWYFSPKDYLNFLQHLQKNTWKRKAKSPDTTKRTEGFNAVRQQIRRCCSVPTCSASPFFKHICCPTKYRLYILHCLPIFDPSDTFDPIWLLTSQLLPLALQVAQWDWRRWKASKAKFDAFFVEFLCFEISYSPWSWLFLCQKVQQILSKTWRSMS